MGIKWTGEHPETIATGATVLMAIGIPDDEFWTGWRNNKEDLKDQGYNIFKAASPEGKAIWYVKKPKRELQPPTERQAVPDSISHPMLYTYQNKHLRDLWAAITGSGAVVDGSDTGTGKTPVSIALCSLTGARPAIVCPKAVIPAWREWCIRLNVTPVFIGNYESFKANKSKFGYLEKRYYPYQILRELEVPPSEIKISPKGTAESFDEALAMVGIPRKRISLWEKGNGKKFRQAKCRKIGQFIWRLPKDTLLIFDEVHKCKGDHTQNAKMLQGAKPYKTLCLSATIGHSPRDLRSLGYLLGLHNLYNFDSWSLGLGCYQNIYNAWACVDPAQAMLSINSQIFPSRGARMKISEIPEFPETLITAEMYELDDVEKLNKEYDKLLERCNQLKKQGESHSEVLTQILRFRQATELRKVPIFISETEELLESGHSVVIFVNFIETRIALQQKLNCRATIDGTQSAEEREACIQAFQSNRERLIICMIQAGGVGVSLHDIHGGHTRAALISANYSATELKQCFGRVHRAGAKTKSLQRVVYLAKTIEEKICRAVNSKINSINTLNDGDLASSDILNLLKGKA